MKRSLGIVLLLMAFALLVFLFLRYKLVPDSAPYDMVLEDIQGNNIELPLSDKPVVLSLMQSWCGPCMAELNQWSDSLAAIENPPFRVIAVTDESPEIALRLSWLCKAPHSLLLRSRTSFSEIGVRTFPTNYIFNPQGIIIHKQLGALDLADPEIRNLLRLNR